MSAITELRDALDDAIRRAYCEPTRMVDGEDPEVVRSLARAALISDPARMRHLVAIQDAAWSAVELATRRSPDDGPVSWSTMADDDRCTVPPAGWWCSREPGHDGPCAARPIEAR